MTPSIGFVGAGQMGEPMVRRLLVSGRDVTVYARRAEVRERLRAAGAAVVDSVAELATGRRIIVACLFSDAQVVEVAGGADGLLAAMDAGSILLSHTTGTGATLRTLAAARPDIHVLDAPVSGTADDIDHGRLTVLIGGTDAAIDEAVPVVEAYSSTVIRTGAAGTALDLKLVNNVLFAANAQVLAAAVKVANDLGIESARFLDALAACSADSKVAGVARGLGGMAAFSEAAGRFLRKDVSAALDAAGEAGTHLGLLDEVLQRGPLVLTATSETVE